MEINKKLKLLCLAWRLYDQKGLSLPAIHRKLKGQLSHTTLQYYLEGYGPATRLNKPYELKDQIEVLFLYRVLNMTIREVADHCGISYSGAYGIIDNWNMVKPDKSKRLDVSYTRSVLSRARAFYSLEELETQHLFVTKPTLLAWTNGRAVYVKYKHLFERLERKVTFCETQRSSKGSSPVVEYLRRSGGPKVRPK